MYAHPLVLLILGSALKECWCAPTSTPQITDSASVTLQNASYIPGIFTSGLLIIPFTPAQQVYINSGIISNTSVLTGYTLPTVSKSSSTKPPYNIKLASLTNPLASTSNVVTNTPVTDTTNIIETTPETTPTTHQHEPEKANGGTTEHSTDDKTPPVDDKDIDVAAQVTSLGDTLTTDAEKTDDLNDEKTSLSDKINGDKIGDTLTSDSGSIVDITENTPSVDTTQTTNDKTTQNILPDETSPTSNNKITEYTPAEETTSTTNNKVTEDTVDATLTADIGTDDTAENTPANDSIPTTYDKTEAVTELSSTEHKTPGDGTQKVPEGSATHTSTTNTEVTDETPEVSTIDEKDSDNVVLATAEEISPKISETAHHVTEEEPMIVDDKSGDELNINVSEVNGDYLNSQNGGEHTENAGGSIPLTSGGSTEDSTLGGTQGGPSDFNPGENVIPQPMYSATIAHDNTPATPQSTLLMEDSAGQPSQGTYLPGESTMSLGAHQGEMHVKPSGAIDSSQTGEVMQPNYNAVGNAGAAGHPGIKLGSSSTGSNWQNNWEPSPSGAGTYTSNQNNNWGSHSHGDGGSGGYTSYSSGQERPQGSEGSYQYQPGKTGWQSYGSGATLWSPNSGYYGHQGYYGLNNGFTQGNTINEKPSTSNSQDGSKTSGSVSGQYPESSATGGSGSTYYSHYNKPLYNGAKYGSMYNPGYVTTVSHPYAQYASPSKTSYMVAPLHQVVPLTYKPTNAYVAIPTTTNIAASPVAKKTETQ